MGMAQLYSCLCVNAVHNLGARLVLDSGVLRLSTSSGHEKWDWSTLVLRCRRSPSTGKVELVSCVWKKISLDTGMVHLYSCVCMLSTFSLDTGMVELSSCMLSTILLSTFTLDTGMGELSLIVCMLSTIFLDTGMAVHYSSVCAVLDLFGHRNSGTLFSCAHAVQVLSCVLSGHNNSGALFLRLCCPRSFCPRCLWTREWLCLILVCACCPRSLDAGVAKLRSYVYMLSISRSRNGNAIGPFPITTTYPLSARSVLVWPPVRRNRERSAAASPDEGGSLQPNSTHSPILLHPVHLCARLRIESSQWWSFATCSLPLWSMCIHNC